MLWIDLGIHNGKLTAVIRDVALQIFHCIVNHIAMVRLPEWFIACGLIIDEFDSVEVELLIRVDYFDFELVLLQLNWPTVDGLVRIKYWYWQINLFISSTNFNM